MGDFNLALVVVAAVVCFLVLLFNVYLLINYQHPDDANQAYFPKAVVVFGLSVAAISILMLPADVANRQACRRAIYNGACNLTLPMKELWLAVYITDAVLVFFVIPFAMFYYEGDQDKSVIAFVSFCCRNVIQRFVILADLDSACFQERSKEVKECTGVGFSLCSGLWSRSWDLIRFVRLTFLLGWLSFENILSSLC